MICLLTGPVRSGKSTYAQRLAARTGLPVTYVATHRIDPEDREFDARLERHRADRPSTWDVVETAAAVRRDLYDVLEDCTLGRAMLVDSLGSWVSDLLYDLESDISRDYAGAERMLERLTSPFLERLPAVRGDLFLVSEETGWGVVPPSPLGRLFRDGMGRVNQRVAHIADRSLLVVAGCAIELERLSLDG